MKTSTFAIAFSIGGVSNHLIAEQQDATRRLLLAAMHRLNELGVTDLGELTDFTQGSPAPAGTATTTAPLANLGTADGWGTPGVRIDSIENSLRDLTTRVDAEAELTRFERKAMEADIREHDRRITALADATYEDRGRLRALYDQAERQRIDNVRIEATIDRLEERIANLERVELASGSHLREASWLYQAINPALDAIDEHLAKMRKWVGGAPSRYNDASSSVRFIWNDAVLRDLRACNKDLDAAFESIIAFNGTVHEFGQAIDFYAAIRRTLLKFSVDTCSRLGIPPAPR